MRTSSPITFVGGIVGLATFLGVGLLPALLYGGYAGLILATAIWGNPIHEHILAQGLIVMGVVAGALSIGGIFVLGGAIVGSGIGELLSTVGSHVKVSGKLDKVRN